MPKASRRGRLVLIDAHSLIYRAFFALPPMSTSQGLVTNAAYGFTSMLALVFGSRPEHAIATFDLGRPVFRTEAYPAYKQGRRPTPDDLVPQFDLCRRLLESLSIPIEQLEGFEADDLIGTLARQGAEQGLQVTIVSGDLDCLQLVDERVEALVPRRGITETMVYGPEQVRQRYSLNPIQMIDFKALRGDASDNIPGVPGVGDKTATQLLTQYGSVENLLDHLDELKEGRVKRSLTEHATEVRLGKQLVTIRRDAPLTLDLEASRWLRYDPEVARQVFDELEFRQLLARIPPPDVAPLQPTLSFEAAAPVHDVRLAGAQDLAALVAALTEVPAVSLFGLWDGGPREGALAGLGIALPGPEVDGETPADAWYVPHGLLGQVLPHLPGRALATHDPKELQLALEAVGGPADLGWRFSTGLAAYLLGAGARDPRLEDLANEFLGLSLASSSEVFGTGRKARAVVDADDAECADFAGARAAAILGLEPRLQAEMRNLAVDHLFYEVELPLARVLADMERDGVAIDVPYLREMQEELAQQLNALEAEVHEVAGQAFNLNAPQQLAKLLFEDLGLPVGKRTKTGYSTDADTLEGLRDKHAVVPLILEHRTLSKLKSTYVDALPELVDERTARLHTSWNQASTATGRLSSSNPNLMNIPMRTELGQRIRRAFRAERAGDLLYAADYSQIELRIAAHLSEDPTMLSAFGSGDDIHTATAARIFKVPIGEVTPDQRRLAKVANFGSIYGQGEYGLSLQMGIPRDEARAFLGEYWRTYGHLKEWLDTVRLEAREAGYVVSATGRRRAIPDLRSPNYQLRQAAERMAVNFPIQSLAADIIKVAMVRLHAEMAAGGLGGRMLLQVHDELVFEIPAAEADRFGEMVPRVMTGAYELLSRLEVESRVGPNWSDMQRTAVALA